jgi:agmatine deiminase
LWQDNLRPAQQTFVAMCEAIADLDDAKGCARGERLEVLVPDEAREREATEALRPLVRTGAVRLHRVPYGDIWLRDTAPLFVRDRSAGDIAATTFDFNGWGGQYVQAHDEDVAPRIAAITGRPRRHFGWVLEGGSVDVDGQGTCLTTRECLLHTNRNPGMSQAGIEKGLKDALGVEKVVWLTGSLQNDPTNGHVDTLARFVQVGVAVCMDPREHDDPNKEALRVIARELAQESDARGRKIEVVRIPSPGRVVSARGDVVPASYVNFYVGNRIVVVPTYRVAADDEAVRRIGSLFPDRKAIGIDAHALVWNGGAFHCITQQEPAARPRGES